MRVVVGRRTHRGESCFGLVQLGAFLLFLCISPLLSLRVEASSCFFTKTTHQDVADLAVSLLINNTNNSYSDGTGPIYLVLTGPDGPTSRSRGSGFVSLVLGLAYNWTREFHQAWVGAEVPESGDYYDAIMQNKRFRTIRDMHHVRRGDFIVVRYLGESVTGMSMLVHNVSSVPRVPTDPIVAGTTQWEVWVTDSTETYHGSTSDTRGPQFSVTQGGVGHGRFRIYADNVTGEAVGYTFSISASSAYYGRNAPDKDRRIVVARLQFPTSCTRTIVAPTPIPRRTRTRTMPRITPKNRTATLPITTSAPTTTGVPTTNVATASPSTIAPSSPTPIPATTTAVPTTDTPTNSSTSVAPNGTTPTLSTTEAATQVPMSEPPATTPLPSSVPSSVPQNATESAAPLSSTAPTLTAVVGSTTVAQPPVTLPPPPPSTTIASEVVTTAEPSASLQYRTAPPPVQPASTEAPTTTTSAQERTRTIQLTPIPQTPTPLTRAPDDDSPEVQAVFESPAAQGSLTTTRVAAGTTVAVSAAAAGGGGGAAADAQAMVVLSQMACSKKSLRQSMKALEVIVAPLNLASLPSGRVLGSLILIVSIFGLHALGSAILSRAKGTPMSVGSSITRFPSLSLVVVRLLSQGLSVASFLAFTGAAEDVTAVGILIGVLGLLALFATTAYFSWFCVAEGFDAKFFYFEEKFDGRTTLFWPRGYWLPESYVSRFSTIFKPQRDYEGSPWLRASAAAFPMVRALVLGLIGSLKLSSCDVQFIIFASACLIFSVYYVVMKPHRYPLCDLLVALSQGCLAFMALTQVESFHLVAALPYATMVTSLVGAVNGVYTLLMIVYEMCYLKEEARRTYLQHYQKSTGEVGEHLKTDAEATTEAAEKRNQLDFYNGIYSPLAVAFNAALAAADGGAGGAAGAMTTSTSHHKDLMFREERRERRHHDKRRYYDQHGGYRSNDDDSESATYSQQGGSNYLHRPLGSYSPEYRAASGTAASPSRGIVASAGGSITNVDDYNHHMMAAEYCPQLLQPPELRTAAYEYQEEESWSPLQQRSLTAVRQPLLAYLDNNDRPKKSRQL